VSHRGVVIFLPSKSGHFGRVLRDTMLIVYHKVMTSRKLDRYDAVLTVSTRGTPNGVIAIELKVTCPPNHPTGVTTALLRLISAADLHGTTKKPPVDMKSFLRSQTTKPSWQARQGLQSDLKLLSAVAELYLAALREGLPPTKAIQLWSGASRPTASRWVRQARDLGLIGKPTKPGRPGDNRRGRNHKTIN